MSGKDKDNTFSKLKQFFRMSKTSGGGIRERNNFVLTVELERELRPETPVAQRVKALKELGDHVKTNRLEDTSIEKLWELTKDLILHHKPIDQRQTALNFYKQLIQGQYESLTLMRRHFFHVILDHDVPEDTYYRLELLKSLTDTGKDITNFEENIGRFMLNWVPRIVEMNLTETYLEILVNIIKYNATYLDKDIVVGIVQHACEMSCIVEDTHIALLWLSVLDTIIRYCILPNEILTICIIALCRAVNREAYCQTAWKIMKNLLGTNLGHASLLTMCSILNDRRSCDEAVLRGAVFHINMGLWGSTTSVTPMLRCSPSTVLLSFLHALESRHIIVTYEVVLSIQRLIQKCPNELAEHSWDVICRILEAISDNIIFYERQGLSKDSDVTKHFHETLDWIETILQKHELPAEPEMIYGLIEKVFEDRPKESVMRLMDYRTSRISATRPLWLQSLNGLIDRFYKSTTKSNIRVKAVMSLMQIMEANRAAYEEEILERIVLPNFSTITTEKDILVRAAVAQMLIDFTVHCETKRCLELLDILEKMLNRPFDTYAVDGIVCRQESDVQDVVIVVEGLVKIFLHKLYHLPSQHAIKVYNMLIEHLELHYSRPNIIQASSAIKYRIFSWIMMARANASFHIGYPDKQNAGVLKFSPYLGIDGPYQQQYAAELLKQAQATASSQSSQNDSFPTALFTPISIRRGCKIIVRCLESEKDWQVVHLLLKELPNVMQNKALIQGNDVDALARTLYKMYFDDAMPETYYSAVGPKPTVWEFRSLVMPALASLALYHQSIEPSIQVGIVEALKKSLFSRIARLCVEALTVMILEMPETLVRLLPDLLWEMTKMSNTVSMAVPVLEFLSTLSRLPNHRFANFVTLQYMYVLAISIPYTNPDRYDHYTVSLAHHVIAGWFLKCRLSLRRNLINYIIMSLESNIQMPFQDMRSKGEFISNEDSSNRKRSSSLTEQGSRRRESQKLRSDLLYAFHMELVETCIDFLARHTFSPCSTLPKRLPTTDFLLVDGRSSTWLVGHNLVTITTSGCSASPFRNGLCDRCSLICKSNSAQMISKNESGSSLAPMSPDTSLSSDNANKRYTKASLQHSNANESESTDLTSSTSSSAAATPFYQQQRNSKFFQQNSTDGRHSSSSGSLEALSRRGSNPDTPDPSDNFAKNLSSTLGNTLLLPQMPALPTTALPSFDRPRQLCACSCTGWAEIYIRRPTGDMSWVMRIQNQINYESFTHEFPLHDLTTLFTPSYGGGIVGNSFLDQLQKKENAASQKSVSISDQFINESSNRNEEEEVSESRRILEKMKESLIKNAEPEQATSSSTSGPIDIPGQNQKRQTGTEVELEPEDDDIAFDDGDASRSRNPVRRVNSSPEMSSNWRNQKDGSNNGNTAIVVQANQQASQGGGDSFQDPEHQAAEIEHEKKQQQQQKKTNFTKDMRVSCEAIPEEIAGSTPPSLTGSVTKDSADQLPITTVTATAAQPQQQATSVLMSSTSLPEPAKDIKAVESISTPAAPKKQLSADDVPAQPTEPVATPQLSVPPQQNINLKIPMEMPKITTKPPQSPSQVSPRVLAQNAAEKIANSIHFRNTHPVGSYKPGEINTADNHNDLPRGRSKTISVVPEHHVRDNYKWQPARGSTRSGINPSFVFLQLYHTGELNATGRPIVVDKANQKAIKLLDLIPPFETHKIGVLYVGPGQCNNETEILKNRYGSLRYAEFLRNLGTLVAIKDAKEHNLFINFEASGRDGNFTYIWQDDIVQVTFHVATLMPNKEQDPNCNEKKKHIGNDYVSIVYNASGEEYNLNTIKGQFNYASVIVQPLELNSNRVFVLAKDEISKYVCHSEPKLVSDNSAPLLARQLALHANLASLVSRSLNAKNQSPYASNWLERLRKIKNLRVKILNDLKTKGSHGSEHGGGGGGSGGGGGGASSSQDLSSPRRSHMNDFTEYT